jgi:hypothetical protein
VEPLGTTTLADKNETKNDLTYSAKHSSLERYGIDYNCKMFYGISSCVLYYKSFTIVNYDCNNDS